MGCSGAGCGLGLSGTVDLMVCRDGAACWALPRMPRKSKAAVTTTALATIIGSILHRCMYRLSSQTEVRFNSEAGSGFRHHGLDGGSKIFEHNHGSVAAGPARDRPAR